LSEELEHCGRSRSECDKFTKIELKTQLRQEKSTN